MQSLSLVYTHESSIITRRGFIESGEDGARGSFEIPLWQADKCQLRGAGKRTWTAIQSTHTRHPTRWKRFNILAETPNPVMDFQYELWQLLNF